MKRTRRRIPSSCLACRRKKAKCDRKIPCGSCKLNNTVEDCTYESKEGSAKSQNNSPINSQDEIDMLRARINELEIKLKLLSPEYSLRQDITISRSSDKMPTIGKCNQISGHSHDNEIESESLVERFGVFTVKNSNLIFFGPTSYVCLLRRDKYASKVFDDYIAEEEGNYNEFFEYQFTEHLDYKNNEITLSKSVFPNIINELPPLNIIHLLLKRFFNFCYPFAPFFDEDLFHKDISPLLIESDNKTKITLDVREPHCTIAALLIMLRFAFITLPLRDYYANKLTGQIQGMVHEIIMSKTTISPAYIDCAKQLTIATATAGKVNLKVLQATLLLRVYKLYCPEHDDGWTDSGILSGIIVQMARYHGLSKNPKFYPIQFIDLKAKYIWQKIWIEVSYLDVTNAFSLGKKSLISDVLDDNMLHIIEDINKLSQDIDSPSTIRQLIIMAYSTRSIRALVESIEDKKINNASQLVDATEQFKIILQDKLRSFQQLYDSQTPIEDYCVDRAQEFVLRMELTVILYSLYFLIFSIAEKEGNYDLGNKYLSLALERGLIILKIGLEYAENPSSMFGSELETLVSSSIWKACFKASIVISSVFYRVYQGEFSLIKAASFFRSPDSYGLISWIDIDYSSDVISLKKLILKLNLFYSKCEILSDRYFTCFGVCLAFRMLLTHIDSTFPEFDTNPDHFKEVLKPSNYGTKDYNTIEEYWLKKPDLLDFDLIFSQLHGSDFDPFLNDIPMEYEIVLEP